jgi:hypothetical protein
MTVPLTQALKRKGLAAPNGTKETLTAAAPGTLTQKIYTPAARKVALTSKTKSVLIASGRHTFAAAGKGTLRLRLTAAGRRTLRRAKSLRITIVTRFVPTAGTPVLAVKRLTVKTHATRSARALSAPGVWTVTRVRH